MYYSDIVNDHLYLHDLDIAVSYARAIINILFKFSYQI